MLIDPLAYATVGPLLGPGDFFVSKNRLVYEAIGAAANDGGVDLLTIQDCLERAGNLETVGGAAYLTQLLNATPSAFRAEQYAKIIREYAARRRYLGAASDIAKAAYDTEADLGEVQARAESAVMGARREDGHRRADSHDLSSQVYERWHTLWETGQMYGIPTGLGPLDDCLGGLEPGVYVIAGRPSIGKTSVALQMASGIVSLGLRGVWFTIEMSASQVWERLATSLAGVPLKAVKEGRTTPDENQRLMDKLAEISEWPLTIFDQTTLRPGDVLAGVRQIQVEHGEVAVVFVDGLWLMTPTRERENRTQTLGGISREMKRAQGELGIPVVMMHQLSRALESRSDKRPILSDLRDSGDVEQDTDVALMLYRSGYYNLSDERANVMELWVRKNRLGGPSNEKVEMYWIGHRMQLAKMSYRGAEGDG